MVASLHTADDLMVEARRLSALLIKVSEQSRAGFAAALSRFDLPVHLARAVMQLDDPAPMRELAESLACDRSHITGLADQLEERGLVARVPAEDRRVKLLELTPKGRDLRGELSDAVASSSKVLQRLSADERRALEALLLKLLDGDVPGDACTEPA